MRSSRLVVGLAFVLALTLNAADAEARKSYYAERFDVSAVLEPGGSLLVTETVVFRLEGGSFTQVYRTLPARRSDGIDVVMASGDGLLLPFGSGEDQVEVSGNRNVKVTWRFAPVSDTARTFVLRYRLRGVIEQRSDADLLRWSALPSERPYDVRAVHINVAFPAGTTLVAPVSLRSGRGTITTSPSNVNVLTSGVRKDRSLVLSLAFAPGTIATEPPAWQAREIAAARFAPLFIAFGAAIALAGTVAILLYASSRRRPSASSEGLESPVPPDDLPVAMAGALLQTGARPAWPQAVATMLALAERGGVRFEERSKRLKRREFAATLVRRPDGLRPHEQALLDQLFGAADERTTATAADLRRFAGKFRRFADPLKQEMRVAGMFDDERERAARHLRNVGIALVVFGGLLTAVVALLASRFGAWPLFVVGGIEVVGLVALILTTVASPLSDAGAWRAGQWRAFAAYVKSVAAGRRPAPDPTLVYRYLPYAAAFGVAPQWVKRFVTVGPLHEMPAWFAALGEGDERAGALAAMIVAVSASGTSGAGAGVHGASGGGASGAR